jgi:YegS/Rv2252/BmrU family lipid kinase
VIAAGGDGTVNEVLNGMADVPDGFERAKLGLIPIGTVNVFARELGCPMDLGRSLSVIERGRVCRMDLATASWEDGSRRVARHFVQLAGVGLDARAIELVSLRLKQWAGPLAYVWSMLRVLQQRHITFSVAVAGREFRGVLLLLGNGRYYGGPFPVFPAASLQDGRLDACLFERLNLLTVCQVACAVLGGRTQQIRCAQRFQSACISVCSPERTPFELEGEAVGQAPVEFTVQREKLQVIVP